ncbi:amylopullulanase [Lacticaseibacillus camelliae DSM 22697 = JCM 13995]|uniref:Amylopullulanase n=2 Tax=Lacticaseibacillus camelliae TaxID=381742 RepID=A0A0R2FA53_9LACO|nr:glycoside hydrolase family 13 protein [Lacticaseibacillus camelliae]KRN23301.1 amylopullulanase [Lacticaseibacillus camelliae DSM 22697 = JCM 13995]
MEYDSFLDRQPGGAVTAGTALHFTVRGTDADSVMLMLRQDGQAALSTNLAHTADAFEGATPPLSSGLWFYRFVVVGPRGTQILAPTRTGLGGVSVAYQEQAAAAWYQLTVVARQETVPAWYENARIYHIFVDRFNNGNADGHVNAPKSNTFLYGQLTDDPYYVKDGAGEVVRWDFYGGNLQGISQQLDLIQQRGFTALYLSPIFEAASNHRYDTGDYFKIDPVLGTLADFKALVQAVHARGMHLILDGVFNHVGRDSRYFNALGHYPTVGAAQDAASPYADWFTFKHFPDDYSSWWGVMDLPAINKQSQSFHQFIAGGPDSVLGYWTGLGVDGWRLDVADELDLDFLRQIRQLLDRYPDRVVIGEVWEDASNKVAYGTRRPYLMGDMLQSVMNYPQRTLILEFVLGRQSAAAVLQQLLSLRENYPAAVFNSNFTSLGTHDTPRVLTVLNGDLTALAQAVLLWTVLPGNQVGYYGDEVGLTGSADPANRKYYPWRRENQTVLNLYAQAAKWRQEPALQAAALFTGFTFGAGLGVVRESADQTLVALFNPTKAPLTFSRAQADLRYLSADQQVRLRTTKIPAHSQVLQLLD